MNTNIYLNSSTLDLGLARFQHGISRLVHWHSWLRSDFCMANCVVEKVVYLLTCLLVRPDCRARLFVLWTIVRASGRDFKADEKVSISLWDACIDRLAFSIRLLVGVRRLRNLAWWCLCESNGDSAINWQLDPGNKILAGVRVKFLIFPF